MAIKAALELEQIEYPFSHDLERLLALVPEGWTVRSAEAGLPGLSEWAVESRYPGEPEATPENARAALVAARAVVEAATATCATGVSDDPAPQADRGVPNGVPDDVVRTVSENARTLKFTDHGFEED